MQTQFHLRSPLYEQRESSLLGFKKLETFYNPLHPQRVTTWWYIRVFTEDSFQDQVNVFQNNTVLFLLGYGCSYDKAHFRQRRGDSYSP
jgi:hypothetical protein